MSENVNQPSPAPTAKVTAAAVGGLVATVVLSLSDALEAFDLPTLWDSLVTGATAVASGYLKKSKRVDV